MTPIERYIGLISGTSMDGLDCVIAEFTDDHCHVLAAKTFELPQDLRQHMIQLSKPSGDDIDLLGHCDIRLGQFCAQAVLGAIESAGLKPTDITAIGSHGQTVRHRPGLGFTLQIGCPNTLALETGIKTIAQFRRKDMTLGGEGAPLVPVFHQYFFSATDQTRVVANIGGIANITVLPPKSKSSTSKPVIGFDTGPGNTLMDQWIQQHHQMPFDKNGNWGKGGQIIDDLLQTWLRDPYFSKAAPKSTGREYFHLQWLKNLTRLDTCDPQDIQCSLAELSALSLANSIKQHSEACTVYLCGGGSHNAYLKQRLAHHLPAYQLAHTDALGIPVDSVEAATFAFLAREFVHGKAANMPSISGASRAHILGNEYLPH